MDDPLNNQLVALEIWLSSVLQQGFAEDDMQLKEWISERLSQILMQPGGAESLVSRYGKDKHLAILRPLAFLLARGADHHDGAHALAPSIMTLISEIETDDPWPRLNLCTAIQYLLMFGAMPQELDKANQTKVFDLLRDALVGPPSLRSTAAAVVADLYYGQHTTLVPDVGRTYLCDMLLALCDDTDELTRREAQGLRDFLSSQGTEC